MNVGLAEVSDGDGTARAGAAARVLQALLLVFVVACVFDPADRLLGVKVWLFLALGGLTVLETGLKAGSVPMPAGLVAYCLFFVAVPLFSIMWYHLSNGREPYEGVGLLKAHLLIGLSMILVVSRIDLIPMLSAVLTCLAVVVIAMAAMILAEPDTFDRLKPFGDATGMFILDKRTYGEGVTMLQTYFVTSPMLVVSIAHYFDRMVVAERRSSSAIALLLMLVSVLGMALAGTRNNLFIAVLLPGMLLIVYAHRPWPLAFAGAGLGIAGLIYFSEQIAVLLDPTEVSNNVKLALVNDYFRILADPWVLAFGQGLGAYHYWSAKGLDNFVSELTYLELIRNFGLAGAALMLALVLVPVVHAFRGQRTRREHALAAAYFLYLVMCASNPNLFCSMGILILSALMANIYRMRLALGTPIEMST